MIDTNCLDYVKSEIPEKTVKQLEKALINHDFLAKSDLKFGQTFVFAQHYHVGFGTLKECYDIETDEVNDGKLISRNLSLYDDSLKIVIINPKRIERSEKE